MQETQVNKTRARTATVLKAVGRGGGSPPAGTNYNNYQVAKRGAADPVKRSLPVRVVSAFPGRIRLQAPAGSCRSGRLQALAARLALVPGVRKAEVVPDANSIVVRYPPVERDLAAVLGDIEAITGASRPRPKPLEDAGRFAVPGSDDLCALVGPVLSRLPAYVRLGWALAKEPAIPWRHKTLLCLFPVYCISPVNLLAQSIPVLGLVDEAVWFLVGTAQALAHCPPPVAARHFARLRLAPRQLEEDVKTVLAVVWHVAGRLLGLAPPAVRPAGVIPVPGVPLRVKGPSRRPHVRSWGGLEPTKVLHAA